MLLMCARFLGDMVSQSLGRLLLVLALVSGQLWLSAHEFEHLSDDLGSFADCGLCIQTSASADNVDSPALSAFSTASAQPLFVSTTNDLSPVLGSAAPLPARGPPNHPLV